MSRCTRPTITPFVPTARASVSTTPATKVGSRRKDRTACCASRHTDLRKSIRYLTPRSPAPRLTRANVPFRRRRTSVRPSDQRERPGNAVAADEAGGVMPATTAVVRLLPLISRPVTADLRCGARAPPGMIVAPANLPRAVSSTTRLMPIGITSPIPGPFFIVIDPVQSPANGKRARLAAAPVAFDGCWARAASSEGALLLGCWADSTSGETRARADAATSIMRGQWAACRFMVASPGRRRRSASDAAPESMHSRLVAGQP